MSKNINSIFNILVFILIISNITCLKENQTNKTIYIQPNYTSYFVNSTIKTLNERNFDTIVKNNNSINYLILFTFRRCPKCNKLITTIENVEKYYLSKKNTTIKFAKIDCYTSGWACMRFDLFKIPIYIYITEEKYASFMPNDSSEEELINFIESQDKIYKNYPKKIGFFGVFMKLFHYISENIQKKMYFWNEACTFLVILILLGSFIYYEYAVCKACCESNKNNNVSPKKDNHKENKKDTHKENKKDTHKENKKDIHKENNKKKVKKE